MKKNAITLEETPESAVDKTKKFVNFFLKQL